MCADLRKNFDFLFQNQDFGLFILSSNCKLTVAMRLLGGSQCASLSKYTSEIDPVGENTTVIVFLPRLEDSIGENLS